MFRRKANKWPKFRDEKSMAMYGYVVMAGNDIQLVATGLISCSWFLCLPPQLEPSWESVIGPANIGNFNPKISDVATLCVCIVHIHKLCISQFQLRSSPPPSPPGEPHETDTAIWKIFGWGTLSEQYQVAALARGLLQIFPRQRRNLIANFPKKVMLSLCNTMIARKTLRILTTGNLLFSWKQMISLSTNFPVHVNEGKLVDKEILCLRLNFPLAYHMHAGNLEDKGKISLLHEERGKYEVYLIPSQNKRIRGDHGIIEYTVKPVLSGSPIKRTPFIKRTLAWVPKFSYNIYCITNLY